MLILGWFHDISFLCIGIGTTCPVRKDSTQSVAMVVALCMSCPVTSNSHFSVKWKKKILFFTHLLQNIIIIIIIYMFPEYSFQGLGIFYWGLPKNCVSVILDINFANF